uniref:Uncharacterized protein n=1 Tax=Cannabis sativa TaxID=3483 RepID=A0A803P581_CANSA
AGKDRVPSRPKTLLQVPNSRAPDASTSGSEAKPMEELLVTLAQTYSPDSALPPAPDKTVTPGRVDTPAVSSDSGIPPEVEEYTVPPGIVLTPVLTDEERQQLRIAKHNYAMAEYTKGNAEVEALKK